MFISSTIGSNSKQSGTDAAKAVGGVNGADILKAIFEGNGGKSAKLAKNAESSTTDAASAKDAIIAGAIALKAMAKCGK